MSLRDNPFNWILTCCTDNNNFRPALSIEDKFLLNCHSLIRYSVISVIMSHLSKYVVLHKWSLSFFLIFWWILFEIEKSVSRHFEWVLTKLNWNNFEFILFYELHWSSPSHLKYLLTKIFCDLSDTKSSTFSYRYLQLKINATSPLMPVTSHSPPLGSPPCKPVDRQQKSSLIRNLGVKSREKTHGACIIMTWSTPLGYLSF